MAGGVDQVELVGLAVLGRVVHGDRVGLDGDAPLALQVHRIEQLGLLSRIVTVLVDSSSRSESVVFP